MATSYADHIKQVNHEASRYRINQRIKLSHEIPYFGWLVVVDNKEFRDYATVAYKKELTTENSALILSNAANCTLGWITSTEIKDIDPEDGRVLSVDIVKGVFLFNTHKTVVYNKAEHLTPGNQYQIVDLINSSIQDSISKYDDN
jgi:hypothetical protein